MGAACIFFMTEVNGAKYFLLNVILYINGDLSGVLYLMYSYIMNMRIRNCRWFNYEKQFENNLWANVKILRRSYWIMLVDEVYCIKVIFPELYLSQSAHSLNIYIYAKSDTG